MARRPMKPAMVWLASTTRTTGRPRQSRAAMVGGRDAETGNTSPVTKGPAVLGYRTGGDVGQRVAKKPGTQCVTSLWMRIRRRSVSGVTVTRSAIGKPGAKALATGDFQNGRQDPPGYHKGLHQVHAGQWPIGG
eukprot:3427924-Amphidinium_carterae.1